MPNTITSLEHFKRLFPLGAIATSNEAIEVIAAGDDLPVYSNVVGSWIGYATSTLEHFTAEPGTNFVIVGHTYTGTDFHVSYNLYLFLNNTCYATDFFFHSTPLRAFRVIASMNKNLT